MYYFNTLDAVMIKMVFYGLACGNLFYDNWYIFQDPPEAGVCDWMYKLQLNA